MRSPICVANPAYGTFSDFVGFRMASGRRFGGVVEGVVLAVGKKADPLKLFRFKVKEDD
jgi:hypothetical protein